MPAGKAEAGAGAMTGGCAAGAIACAAAVALLHHYRAALRNQYSDSSDTGQMKGSIDVHAKNLLRVVNMC